MGKVPFSNPNPNFTTKKRNQHQQQQQQRDAPNGGAFVLDESPAVTQSAASDDASSMNHRRNATTSEFNNRQYVSFKIASYSKKQLTELRARLGVELDQIRHLRHRLESQATPNHNHAPPHSKKSKKLSGKKRPLPDNPVHQKNTNYPNPNLNSNTNTNSNTTSTSASMKACKEILTKLRKHKNGWVFNEPVDVVGMGLHDYYEIIKQPMDLGTVKSKLARDLYQSPLDFAADVRLTFNNALTYNPKGHQVHAMAEQLLVRFEDLFRPLGERIEHPEEEKRRAFDADEEEDLQASDNDNSMRIAAEKSARVMVEDKASDHSEQFRGVQASSSNPGMEHSPVKAAPVKTTKLPKPKAKDPNKREMSLEEKHKLGIGLQSLPPEKMEQVVQIIRKRNGHLKQDGDEIELDIEAVDTETLWELDRLVTNWKKMVSKIKRQALMGNITKNNGELPTVEAAASEPKKPKKGEAGDEDVDIGDEMPMSNFPPVEIEKDVGGHGSSSSSSSSSSSDSDSSSSSDSDSGSSSGSDSDADNAQS